MLLLRPLLALSMSSEEVMVDRCKSLLFLLGGNLISLTVDWQQRERLEGHKHIFFVSHLFAVLTHKQDFGNFKASFKQLSPGPNSDSETTATLPFSRRNASACCPRNGLIRHSIPGRPCRT